MNKKLVFYERYGVEEYYLYDPDKNDLSGWLRSKDSALPNHLDVIDPIDNWVSPRLGIRFDISGELQIYRPNGERFAAYVEIAQQLEQQRLQTEQANSRAAQAESRAEQAESRAARLAERLRAEGIDP